MVEASERAAGMIGKTVIVKRGKTALAKGTVAVVTSARVDSRGRILVTLHGVEVRASSCDLV